MSVSVFHLPAVATAALRNGWAPMVTACGRRGPIRVREGIAETEHTSLGIALSTGVRGCPECMVLWDWSEEHTAFVHLFNNFGQPEWKGPGASLSIGVSTCNRCRSAASTQREARPITCIVRDVARAGVNAEPWRDNVRALVARGVYAAFASLEEYAGDEEQINRIIERGMP